MALPQGLSERLAEMTPEERREFRNSRINRIATLNDAFRRSGEGGRVLVTAGVNALPYEEVFRIVSAVKSFDAFEPGDDPYGEHDFGAVSIGAERFLWKIDYYDREMDGGSEDPADPARTTRVLTIMRADEY